MSTKSSRNAAEIAEDAAMLRDRVQAQASSVAYKGHVAALAHAVAELATIVALRPTETPR